MEESERHFWTAFAVLSVFVFVLLVVGPASRAFREWKIRRAFRMRRRMRGKGQNKGLLE
jgi:hypothetical protein